MLLLAMGGEGFLLLRQKLDLCAEYETWMRKGFELLPWEKRRKVKGQSNLFVRCGSRDWAWREGNREMVA